ncbi:SPT3 Dosage dependent suppressor of Ty-induced promoter mutations-like protein [Microbotryomycetes sp. JL201]|nr:SPT3 Dosage dependent suppressor of Ty-induced promoter mutations-like protein [Microbotryomycetes sp. JL201]
MDAGHAMFERLHFHQHHGSHPGSPEHDDVHGDEHSPASSTDDGSSPSSSASVAQFHAFASQPTAHHALPRGPDHLQQWPRVAGVDDDAHDGALAADAFAATSHAHHDEDDDMRLTGDFWSTAPSTTAASPAASAVYSKPQGGRGPVAQAISMDLDGHDLAQTHACGPSSMGSPEPTLSFAQHFAPLSSAVMPPHSFEMSQPVDLHAVNAGISPHLTSSRQPTPPSLADDPVETNVNQVKDEFHHETAQDVTWQKQQQQQRPTMPERRSTRDRSRVTSRNHSRDTSLSRSNSTTALPSLRGGNDPKTPTPQLSSADLLQATIIGASTNLVTKDAVIVAKAVTKCSQPERSLISKPGSGLELMVLGVPRYGAKSRVETQIKITLALVKPRTPKKGSPQNHDHVDGGYEQFLTFDGSLDPQVNDHYERVGSWSHLRLPGIQALKKRVKKQLKPDPTPEETLLLDVAVIRASEDEEQIFICDGCQQRERKRAQRKKDTNAAKTQEDKDAQPTLTPEQERRKVVVFNCSEFVELTGGEIVLPTRITCYCRHHKEKKGFMVQFTVRNFLGEVIASSSTPPIMITDDHKTKDSRPLQIVQQDDETQVIAPAVANAESKKVKSGKTKKPKSTSAAASQRSKRSVSGRSPAEDGELDESHSVSPVSGTSTPASSSRASTSNKKPKPYDAEARPRKRVSGAHRSPGFAMTPLMGMSPAARTVDLAPLPSSHAPSPAADMGVQYLQTRPAVAFPDQSSALGLGGMATDAVMSDMPAHMMPRQSISTEHSTVTSPGAGGFDWRSSGSSPPLSPRSSVGTSVSTANEFQSMLDAFHSPAMPMSNLPTMMGQMGHSLNPMGSATISSAAAAQAAVLSTLDWSSGASIQHLQQHQLQQPIQRPQPRISRLIPGEGPTHGGIEVTVLGEHFVPDLVCMFGDSPAVPTHYWSSTTLVCVLPPSANPGPVVVGIKGVRLSIDTGTEGLQLFTYRDDSDRGLLELALQVVGLKMTGKLEDASAVAMRIVGNNGQGSSGSAQSSRSSQSPSAPIMTYRDTASLMQRLHLAASSVQTTPTSSRPGSRTGSRTHSRRSSLTSAADSGPPPLPYTAAEGETRNFESIVIKFLSLLDLDASQIPGAAPSLPSSSPPISHANGQRHSLLHLATVLGFHRLAQFLIARGIEVDAADRNGFTPLHFAALYGRVAITRLLLEAGADSSRRNLAGRTAEMIAKMRDDVDVEEVLIRARERRLVGATPMSRPLTTIHAAVRSYEPASAYDSRRRSTSLSQPFSPVSVSTDLDSDTVSNEFDDSDRYDSDEVDSDEVPDSQEDESSSPSDWDAESDDELVSDDEARLEALSLSDSEQDGITDRASEEATDSDVSDEDSEQEEEDELEAVAGDRRMSRNASVVSLHYLLTAEEEQQKRAAAQTPSWATGDSKDRSDSRKRDILSGWPFARPQLQKRHSSHNKLDLSPNVPDVKQLATGGATMNAWEKAARFAIPIQMPELATFQMMASNVVPAALTKSWRGVSSGSSTTKEAETALGEGEGHCSSAGTDSDATVRPSLARHRTDSIDTDEGDRSPLTRDWRNLYGAGPWLRNHTLPPSSPPPMYSPTDHLSNVNVDEKMIVPPWSDSPTLAQARSEEQAASSCRHPSHGPSTPQSGSVASKTRRSHRSTDERAVKPKQGLHNDRMLWLFWIPVLLVALSTAIYANRELLHSIVDSVAQHPILAKVIR